MLLRSASSARRFGTGGADGVRTVGVGGVEIVGYGIARAAAQRFGPCVGTTRRFGTAVVDDVRTVGVVGLGLMGHGIAQAAAQAGMKVVGVEREQAALELGKNRIDASVTRMLAKRVAKGTLTQEGAEAEAARTLANLSYDTRIEAVHDCDLIVEAIVEDMRIKVPFWKQLGALCKPSAIFGSNTSSLPITAQAEASGRPAQMVGLHFFNPGTSSHPRRRARLPRAPRSPSPAPAPRARPSLARACSSRRHRPQSSS